MLQARYQHFILSVQYDIKNRLPIYIEMVPFWLLKLILTIWLRLEYIPLTKHCSHFAVIISADNANGAATGTNMSYVHTGLCPLVSKEIFNGLILNSQCSIIE